MAIINTTAEAKTVTKKTIVWRATVEFDDLGNIQRIDLHGKKVFSDGDTVTERHLRSKTVIPNAANTEQTTRLGRIDGSIEWLWRNTTDDAGAI